LIQNLVQGFFHFFSRRKSLKTLATRYGMRTPRSFARRFVAGETAAEAIETARQIEAQGLSQTLDFLGEGVTSSAEADLATREYIQIAGEIIEAGIGRNLSLKLTQLGLDIDRAHAIDNLRRILDRAEGFFIRIDMESSAYTDRTLEVFETLWNQGYKQIGVVLQAELYRTEQDIRRVAARGARIRLVKGAYVEPKSV
jgi:proline dehydrogenase